jgi:hypothetical protein
MSENEIPIGQRFSLVYLDKGELVSDSTRFRQRIAAFYYDYLFVHNGEAISRTIHRELGVVVPYFPQGGQNNVGKFFLTAELRDVLDSITLIWRVLNSARALTSTAALWHQFVQRAFREENLGYRLDENGGVHFYIDQEFEKTRQSCIGVLNASRYSTVAADIEQAYRSLDQVPPNTRGAIWLMFSAVESLVKLFPGCNITALGEKEVNGWLRITVRPVLGEDQHAIDSANQLLTSLAKWVNA